MARQGEEKEQISVERKEDEGEEDERREVRAVTSGAALIGSRERGPFLCNLWFHSASVSDDCLGEEKAILRGTGCVKRIVSPAAHPSMSNQLHGTEGQQNYWRRGWLRQRRQWYGLNPHLEVPFPHLTLLLKCYFSMLWNVIALWWNRSLQLGR